MAMDPNPFAATTAVAPTPAELQQRRWIRFTWFAGGFATGFVLCWIAYTATENLMLAPQDHTQGLPDEIREGAPEWMKNAKGRHVGHFTIIAAAAPQQASAQVFPTEKKKPRPEVEFEDRDSDGRVDALILTDGRRGFEIVVKDGRFDSYNFSPDQLATSYFDYDMDGRFDFRHGPGTRSLSLMVDSQWRNLFPKGGGKGYVEVDGKRVPAEYVDGRWRIVSPNN